MLAAAGVRVADAVRSLSGPPATSASRQLSAVHTLPRQAPSPTQPWAPLSSHLPPSPPSSNPRLASQPPPPPSSLASWPPRLRGLTTCAAAKSSSGGAPPADQRSAKQGRLESTASTDPRDTDVGGRPAQAAAAAADADEDGFLDLDEQDEEYEGELGGEEYDEGEGAEYDEDEDEDERDDYAAAFLEPDDAPREVATGDTAWGEVVLGATREVLAQPAMKGLELYLFRALPATRKVDIRLDKLDDLYGSPSIDDIEKFQRGLIAALERQMGLEAAGEISFEVSSPGAERLVRVPDELTRFAELPLKVEYRDPGGKDASSVLLLADLDVAGGRSTWRLANVRANAPVKGRALSKKALAQLVSLPLQDISRVRIHVDF